MGKLIYFLRHKFLFSVFVYFFILIFLSLGTWQLIRLNWKIELISEINNSLGDEAVSFDGRYPKNYKKVKFDVDINDTQVIFLYSLNENGEPGFDVINSIKIDLKYYNGNPVIKKIKRISKPGIRKYSKISELSKPYGGLGISILSTSKGVMSDHQAKKNNVGGEILCEIF